MHHSYNNRFYRAIILLLACILLVTALSWAKKRAVNADDDFLEEIIEQEPTKSDRSVENNKDRILMSDIKTLVFHRNRRTTSRRTHSIHQLSCVGGTAGCKVFTPDTVECEQVHDANSKQKHATQWKCSADMTDRVKFSHVDVICEGYEYAEDEYILEGSCGLEFTLDYVDPNDYHQNSYYNHLDGHEKEKHLQQTNPKLSKGLISNQNIVSDRYFFVYSLGIFLSFITFFYILVRYSKRNNRAILGKSTVGHLTSAVLHSKKSC